MCSDRAHAATRDAPGRRTTETRARRRVMALEIMIVRHSAAGCRSRLGAPSPQRSSGLHGGQASSQIIHGEKEVRTSGALGGIAAASTARLETQHPLGSGGPTRRKPLAALLQTARLLLTASLRRKVQFVPAGGVRWSGENYPSGLGFNESFFKNIKKSSLNPSAVQILGGFTYGKTFKVFFCGCDSP